MKPLFKFIGLIVFSIGLFTLADKLQKWEVANNFPYGKLCDVYNNCK
jgi:hypothetical protein